ncbi:cellulase family glycosylhydrolase [Butyrivibrio sp. MC2013]|uniref:cellulase family glycosylhydrolase n=1 Tax=Butyrivibrio sp. MC2013 TaxID=1280686 RepID=UPI000403F8CA|nr:cellulase family glycosylhydrolase [Butyrivibrio sp. MC2013]
MEDFYYSSVKGAVYFPSRVYNAYQTFTMFDDKEIARDMGYANAAGINAFRLFLSYNYYLENSMDFFQKIDIILELAERKGIRIMPVLFEDCGLEFNDKTGVNRDPYTAVCVRSPGAEIEHDRERFSEVIPYLKEFMDRYRDDDRLLAIEIMNEPHIEKGNLEFARFIAEYVFDQKGIVPLTMGCISLRDNLYFADLLDIYEFHDNFPSDTKDFRKELEYAKHLESVIGKPCWITEWQRLREGGPGWGKADIPDEHKVPCLASLADIISEVGIGSFFWSLMVKPAYLPEQRINGTINGLFHEDGLVYSREDFSKISGKNEEVKEYPYPPKWYKDDLELKGNSIKM